MTKKVYVQQPAFKPDFSIYIRQDHKPRAVFDPKKTAVLRSSRPDHGERDFEVVDPREIGKGRDEERF